MKSKWKNFLNLQDKEHHVFTSYSEDDCKLVNGLLQPFGNSNCLFYNPDRDGVPGQPIMRGLIEKGMEQSKITMLFITKNFLSDELCMFMANLAIWKYMKTKGIHRVFPIILQPCKIPRYLKVLNCIHVWKYTHTRSSHVIYQTQAIARLTKAMLEPPPKFRRIRWNGIKTLTWTRNIVEKVKKSALKEKASDQLTLKINPFQLWRLTGVLKHCFLNCRYGHCSFACSGREFTRLITHVKTCRYRPIKCPNKSCPHFLAKWCLDNHIEECTFTLITCPSVGCGEKIIRCQIEQHLFKCQHRSILCQNHHFECDQRLTGKDSEIDLFASLFCNECGQSIMKKDINEHEKYCAKSKTKRKLCKKTVLREEELFHLDACFKAEVLFQCPNIGCGLTKERNKILEHKSICSHASIDCLNFESGCKTGDKRTNMQIHTAKCPLRTDKFEDQKRVFMEQDHTPPVEQPGSHLPFRSVLSPPHEQLKESDRIDNHHSTNGKGTDSIQWRPRTSSGSSDNGRPQSLKDFLKDILRTNFIRSPIRNENSDSDFKNFHPQGNSFT